METELNKNVNNALKQTQDFKSFMAALLVAGENGCTCKACQILKKLKDNMVTEIAGSGSGNAQTQ